MAKKFSELRAAMSPAAQQQANKKAKAMLSEMPLNELRQARGLSQKMFAEVLNVQQPSIAKWKSEPTCTCPRCAATSKPWAASWTSLPAFQTGRSRSATSRSWGQRLKPLVCGFLSQNLFTNNKPLQWTKACRHVLSKKAQKLSRYASVG